ncbi:MAG TPA: hypothetical protein VLE53_01505 [Gemmatimonadaceae bacterium]|nr:hypothetical protein [Gemmatimonadaceae bacterium]
MIPRTMELEDPLQSALAEPKPGATPDEPLAPALLLAFAPMHKRAFGIATGTAAALLIALLTVAALLLPGAREFPLELLNEYFAGYSVSWGGVFIGAGWGFVVGFVAGWFTAFCRNLALAISAFLIRVRAELSQTRDFLDHI